MGSSRPQTPKLAEKLCQIRNRLGLTQAEMVARLKGQRLPSKLKVYPGNISRFEKGLREPPPLLLLAYSRAAGVAVEVLIDAELLVPDILPADSEKGKVKRAVIAQKRKGQPE
jgi:transcriptional regulator with XRE-family HTH domain